MACAPQATFNSIEGLGITLTPPLTIALTPPFVLAFGSAVTPTFAFFLTTILCFMSLIAPAAAAPKMVALSATLTATSPAAAAPATLTETLTETLTGTLTDRPHFSVSVSDYQGDRAQLSPVLGVMMGVTTDPGILAKRTGAPEQRRGAGARS